MERPLLGRAKQTFDEETLRGEFGVNVRTDCRGRRRVSPCTPNEGPTYHLLPSHVGEETRKALIHVVLVMAMEKCVAGIVRHEVDLRLGIAGHADGVLDHP